MEKSAPQPETVQSNFSSTEWSVYEKILHHDYMHHKQIISLLVEHLGTLTELNILELGCGDAVVVSKALKGRDDIKYTGIDSSEEALSDARENLSEAGLNFHLIREDMSKAVELTHGPFNVVLAGFSLHHFRAADMGRILSLCYEQMTAGGMLIIYDVIAREGESYQKFNQRLMNRASEWKSITPKQHADMAAHVMENDFPVAKHTLTKIVEDAGFTPLSPLLMLGTDDLFGFTVCRRR